LAFETFNEIMLETEEAFTSGKRINNLVKDASIAALKCSARNLSCLSSVGQGCRFDE
jgi:hypothetical protein